VPCACSDLTRVHRRLRHVKNSFLYVVSHLVDARLREQNSTMMLDELPTPLVLAPLAGGPSTPELTAAAAEAGAFGFLAAGYLSAATLRDRIEATRALTDRPFGVNVFVPGAPSGPDVVSAYADLLAREAERLGVALGNPRYDDDDWAAKLDLLAREPVAVVSFTFGCPQPHVVDALHRAGAEVWVTVTTPAEAAAAEAIGVDVFVAQGTEAGGHRATWDDGDPGIAGFGVLALLQLLRSRSRLPLVAAGGIATGSGIAAVLAAGARAAALGTAFLLCPEAGTSDVHRAALRGSAPTALTRAFTGRMARGITNRLMAQYGDRAPSAYPEVHYLTATLRQAGRERGVPDVVNLWAGHAYPLAQELPAAELVRKLTT
jgi:nitronate monooxygenase